MEQRNPIQLEVDGHFPNGVAGTLYRTGPSSRAVGDFELSHWFDGFTQVYRFQLLPEAHGSCKVVYNSRRQCDGLMEHARKTKRLDNITFAQKRDPCEGFFGKLKAVFFAGISEDRAENANCGVTIHTPVHGNSGLLETRTDRNQLKTIDRETLEPVGVTDQRALHPSLKGALSCAHAQFDPISGDCYNFNLDFGRFATYRIFRHSAETGEADILATISAADVPPAYLHAFFLSENYVILCVWNAHFAVGGLKVLWERNLLDAITPFDTSQPVHWFVVDRNGSRGLVKRFSSRAMFAFHTVNAYEEMRDDGSCDIFCDVVEYSSTNILHGIYYDGLVSDGPKAGDRTVKESLLTRYKLAEVPSRGSWNLAKDKACAAEVILSRQFNGDLPTINGTFKLKPHRYVYGISDRGKSSFYDCIIKVDTHAQSRTMWCKDKHTPGEALFVPDASRGEKEDGGWLLSCVLDGETGTSYLLCLDAETFEEVGKAKVNAAVGIGFHGAHIG